MFVLWCNGSTTVFGSVCLSSNLGRTTKNEALIIIDYWSFLFLYRFVSLKIVVKLLQNVL